MQNLHITSATGGEPLYPTIESRAAHLLYFVIKDHLLTDGNKRSGSLLFLEYLRRNNALSTSTGEPRFSDIALVGLALLVAESEAGNKDTSSSDWSLTCWWKTADNISYLSKNGHSPEGFEVRPHNV